MSLLLEALKKAELAKQSIKPARAEPALPPEEPIIMRPDLPDISQPLEILANDLPSAEAGRAPLGGLALARLSPLAAEFADFWVYEARKYLMLQEAMLRSACRGDFGRWQAGGEFLE